MQKIVPVKKKTGNGMCGMDEASAKKRKVIFY